MQNYTTELGVCNFLLFNCNYVYLVSFLRYSTSNNDMPLKFGLGAISGNLK